MSKITVELIDTGSIFHDISQGQTITGSGTKEFEKTSKVSKALKNGVLRKVLKKVEKPTKNKSTEVESNEFKESENKGSDDYSELKKAELKELLDEKVIEYDDKATNAELIELLKDS